MKRVIILLLICSIFFIISCKDIMENSMFDKDKEKGEWNSSEWNNSKWGK